ncbi:MAG: hypothetical protein JSS91_00290 [Bacteroidetes bacterium]|nr:hypothetical protein [Bacteroidota bacterium]
METKTLEAFKWLNGQWEGIQGSGVYHEEWEYQSDILMNGKAYFINKGEISNLEKLSLIITEMDIYYTAEVQHNKSPVSFKLTEAGNDEFVFTNPVHDFPQRITYKKESENELKAVIEAEKEGKVKKIIFKLKRIL